MVFNTIHYRQGLRGIKRSRFIDKTLNKIIRIFKLEITTYEHSKIILAHFVNGNRVYIF